ncbi:MAG: family 10 glycosylhydrolase [Phycisphaerales bacterium]|nr:family 10 glycosylhydrolase [Phycisphaerales bacterium]
MPRHREPLRDRWPPLRLRPHGERQPPPRARSTPPTRPRSPGSPRRPGAEPRFDRGQGPHAAWVRDEISSLVRRVSREARRIRPGITMSAAVWRDPDIARDTVLQDAAQWLKDGTLDRVFPMIYTDNNADYTRDLSAWLKAAGKKPVTPGIGAYKHQATQTLEQIRLSEGASGYCLFAYATFFESVNPFEPKDDTAVAVRAARRKALEAVQLPGRPTRSTP